MPSGHPKNPAATAAKRAATRAVRYNEKSKTTPVSEYVTKDYVDYTNRNGRRVDDLERKLEAERTLNEELTKKLEAAEGRLMGLIDMLLSTNVLVKSVLNKL